MAGIPAGLLRSLGQDVSIRAYRGVAAGGAETFATAVTVRGIVEETGLTLREPEPSGDQGIIAVIRCALDTDCPAGSRITLASGATGTAATVKRWDAGTTPAPSHLEITVSGTVTA